MNNKGLIVIVIVILLGIFTVVAMEANEKSPGEQLADDVSEFTEEIGDEIDDHTTAR